MAYRRRKVQKRTGVKTLPFTNRRLPVRSLRRQQLRLMPDLRRYNPSRRSLVGLDGAAIKISYRDNPVRRKVDTRTHMGVLASIPKQTAVCVRRKIRKEVIFAKGKAGKGTRQKKPRFNQNSKLICRR
ncbi:hypothetical protein [Microviridae sp.]|nr:hypothetical protein [Microviridae sp.]